MVMAVLIAYMNGERVGEPALRYSDNQGNNH